MRQKKNGLENLVLITQLGLNVVTPVLICVLLGSWIDKKTGLHTVLIFLILGVLSGGLSAYKMAKHIIDREKEDEDREKKEMVGNMKDSCLFLVIVSANKVKITLFRHIGGRNRNVFITGNINAFAVVMFVIDPCCDRES